MKKCLIFILFLMLITLLRNYTGAVAFPNYDSDPTKYAGNLSPTLSGKYDLNTFILENYNIVSYGFPHGRFMESSNGIMIKDGKLGEYEYLGYNYYDDDINNDRWFKDSSLLGKVFNPDYKIENIIWVKNNFIQAKAWQTYKNDKPFISSYMEQAQFYDADHATAGISPTGYTLITFGDQILHGDYRNYGILQTEVTKDTTGVVRFNYTKDGAPKWTTVEIPPFPEVFCLMTARADPKTATAAGSAVTVSIDTSQSHVQYRDLGAYAISSRHYWASTDPNNYGVGVETASNKCNITLDNVMPNSYIYVKSEVTSSDVAALDIPEVSPTATVYTTLFIGESGAHVNMEPDASAVLKAAPRGSEPFDVTQGIPSGKPLYANVIAREYLSRLEPPVQRSGSTTVTVTVSYPGERVETVTTTEPGPDGTPVTTTTTITVPETQYTSVDVERSYTYWEIPSYDIYGIQGATIKNKAVPGGTVTLTPPGGYNLPVVTFRKPTSRYTMASHSSSTSADSLAEAQSAAEAIVPGANGVNDTLIIDGKHLMDSNSYDPAKLDQLLTSGFINDSILYKTNILIDPAMKNGDNLSTGTITYTRVSSYGSAQPATVTRDIEGINNVYVHTPVYLDAQIQSDTAYNQNPYPTEGTSGLILGRPFTIAITDTGEHRDIPGYGTQDYSSYIKDRMIRFGFDAYYGSTISGGTYLKGDTWYKFSDLNISLNEHNPTFCIPEWVQEEIYEVELRNVAVNDTSSGNKAEDQANLISSNYAASSVVDVEVSGRVYDLAITDIDDPVWDTFFKTRRVFYPGPNNINGNKRPENPNEYTMPVIPGKTVNVTGYANVATKLGYAFKFEIKTIGEYYNERDYLQIKPAFSYVDKNGKNREQADLYYSTPDKRLVKIGSDQDTQTQSMKLNFAERGDTVAEGFTATARALYYIKSIKDLDIDTYVKTFVKVPQNGVTISKFDKILLSEPVRMFWGPTDAPSEVDRNIAFGCRQKWFGKYYLPADCMAVQAGQDPTKAENILKNGYIIVNFCDITVINDDNFNYESLTYGIKGGSTGDGWNIQGYSTNFSGWSLNKGDVFVYYTDKRATDDYYSGGTH